MAVAPRCGRGTGHLLDVLCRPAGAFAISLLGSCIAVVKRFYADRTGRSRVCPRWRLGILVPASVPTRFFDILVLASTWRAPTLLLHRLRKQKSSDRALTVN